MLNIHIFQDYEEFRRAGVKSIEQFLAAKIQANGRALLGLSGGKTPARLYAALGQSKLLDWSKIKAFLIDERVVPWTDQRSNYLMIKENLYAGENAQNLNNFFDFDTSLAWEKAVISYQDNYYKHSQNGLDLIILGVGPDGHFASIFPGYVKKMQDLWAGWTQTEQFEVKDRLTLSPKTIQKAEKIIIWLAGQDKKAILEEFKSGIKTSEEFPIKYLLNHPNLEIFYCESAA